MMALPSGKEETKPQITIQPKNPKLTLYLTKPKTKTLSSIFSNIKRVIGQNFPSGCWGPRGTTTPTTEPRLPMRAHAPLQRRSTSPVTWVLAIICTILIVAVIIGGIVVFIFYEVVQPKVPSISVTYTHLDLFDYSQAGILKTEVVIIMKWANGNKKADARFKDSGFVLSFHGLEIAKLVAKPFGVSKNSSVELRYQVSSSSIPLSQKQMLLVSTSLKQDLVTFDLRGATKTHWKVGLIGSVKFTLHLDCQLKFVYSTKYSIDSICSSKSK